MNRGVAQAAVFALGGFFWTGRLLAPRPLDPAPPIHAPFDGAEVERSVRFFEARTQSDPQGATGWAMLASAYLRRQSEQGDLDDLLRAEASARHSLRVRSHNNPIGLWALAKALMGRHAFAEAQKVAARLGDGALEAECALERGDDNTARRCVARATEKQPNDPAVRALQARLWEQVGRVELAEQSYQSALSLAEARFELNGPALAWFHERLGAFYLTQERFAEARTAYEAALAVFPQSRRGRLGLAQVALREGKNDEARQLARSVALPEAAMLLYRLGETHQWERITSEASGAHVHGRALALFFADTGRNLPEAVRLMRTEWESRKDIHTADALAWVLWCAGQRDEARRFARIATSTGTQDHTILAHAQTLLKETL